MKLTLGEAAKTTGKAKSTILRAIKNGIISAKKGPNGAYQIDPAELTRVFEPNVSENTQQNDTQRFIEHSETLRLKLEILEAERTRERDHMQATIDDLRQRLDRSENRITALLNEPIKRSKRYFWQK